MAEAKEAVDGSRTVVTDILGPVAVGDGGIRPGDILLKVGKVDIHEPEDVLDASFFLSAGDTIPIVVVRDGQKMTLKVEADYDPRIGRTPPLLSTWPGTSPPNRAAIPLGLQPQSVPQ